MTKGEPFVLPLLFLFSGDGMEEGEVSGGCRRRGGGSIISGGSVPLSPLHLPLIVTHGPPRASQPLRSFPVGLPSASSINLPHVALLGPACVSHLHSVVLRFSARVSACVTARVCSPRLRPACHPVSSPLCRAALWCRPSLHHVPPQTHTFISPSPLCSPHIHLHLTLASCSPSHTPSPHLPFKVPPTLNLAS